jgi:hypothetical protein
MQPGKRLLGRFVTLASLLLLVPLATGCGYVKNLRDDAMDCFILGGGIVTPVASTDKGKIGVGPIPPSFGIYAEATELLHLGALYKASGDIELDRRGTAIVADTRAKFGIGPFHYTDVQQDTIIGNDYKRRGNEMDGWRTNMYRLRDPLFRRPGKQLIFDRRREGSRWVLHRGWQDWGVFSLEVAIPEPFFFHSGINVRAGFDISQVFDLILGVFTLDLYDDNAFTFSGDLRFPNEEPEEGEGF